MQAQVFNTLTKINQQPESEFHFRVSTRDEVKVDPTFSHILPTYEYKAPVEC